MGRQITILHGWNDRPGSFRKLGRFLAANGHDVANIWLGEWISTDDDVRIEDVARRMQVVIEELQKKGVPRHHVGIVATFRNARIQETKSRAGKARQAPKKRRR